MSSRGEPVPVSRRRMLGLMAAVGAAVTAGRVDAAHADEQISPAVEPTPAQRADLVDLARRIRNGEGTRLTGGIVVIDGWFLPAPYVSVIEAYGDS